MATPIESGAALRRKLLAIMAECSYIRKDKRNAAMGYSYASEAAIKEKVHAELVRHGVLFQCDVVTFEERIIERVNKDGRAVVEALAKCQFHYIFEDVETGEKREGTFFGTGVDTADKHLYKAITGAIKYILTTTFLIPTGDDPEASPKPAKTSTAAPKAQSTPAPEKHDSNWFKTMVDGFSAMKEAIGSQMYYRILGAHGYEHANELPDRPTAMLVYREMASARSPELVGEPQ